MEFVSGEPVWFIPTGNSGGYPIPGEVQEFHRQGNVLTILSLDEENPGAFTVDNNGSVRKRNSEIIYEDMIAMNDLSEPALLWNIKKRYASGMIYTYIGSILVAVNPYKMYEIYGQPVVKQYEGQVLGSLPPHLFAIGSSAYNKMVKEVASQVVVISGESGSGKTESTKLILGYLALVNKSPSNLITEQILEASPLLESFGNAKTSKNDNSSRFGKYIQVYFENGRITGARITEYLLEKSRIVTQASDERNYHVFYEILKGLGREQKDSYGLTSAEKYFYLNQGGNCALQTDAADFNALMSAFQILGFGSEEIDVIIRILASVLHLGNVYFHRKSLKHGEGVEIGSDAEIQWVAHLLQIHPEGIRKCLTTKITETRKERLATPLSIDQSLDSRDAIAKVLYSSLFAWLVNRINRIVFKGESKSINILDIFGFEVFQENSFEQLCINYANESLQHYLNKHIFKLEQQEYLKEKIDWVSITYNDNLGVINLLSKKPIGILHLLDDESNFPKGTDTSFLEKAHYNHALNESYTRPRMNSTEFGVKHFAGSVMYNVEGFLDKNRDTLRPDVVKLLAGSGNNMVAKMFRMTNPNSPRSAKSGRFVTVKPRAPTVAARFHDSLQCLLLSMSKCHPWFVRCIKPNASKQAGEFNLGIVLEQIRYSGLLETIRIRKLGYPIRLAYAEFAFRFKCLINLPRGLEPKEVTRLILRDIPANEFQPGLTKIFLRESLEQRLEQKLHDLYHNSAALLQKTVRGYLARKRYKRMKASAVVIQAYWRMRREKKFYEELKRSTVVLQRGWRRVRRKRVERKSRTKLRGCVVSGVNHLEIPAELAFVLSKLDDWHPPHTERNLVKLVGEVSRKNKLLALPVELDSHSVAKYAKDNVKNQVLGMKREPISVPFLNSSPHEESVAIFKLVLRLMNDANCSPARQQAITNYIVRKSQENPALQDEVLFQIINQTIGNKDDENSERGFFLLSNTLSALKPSRILFRPLLKYVSDSPSAFSHQLQQKLLAQSESKYREYGPTLLEWRCNKIKANAALTVYYADGEYNNIEVNSWTSVTELAEIAAEIRLGQGSYGWGLELDESEVEGLVFDVIASIEGGGIGRSIFLFGKEEKKTRSLEDLADSYGLSDSKLNSRYRASSEKIWDEPPPPPRPPMTNYDDEKASFLDEPSEPAYGTTNYAESDILSVRTVDEPRSGGGRSGHPRFIKASAKRSSVSGSYSSRAYIERMGEVKSSAMSDTSETPSLASHVRRVRVPSQASDVEQFLDDLFSPVLDGNLDDLSDARSLIQSIKGGGEPLFAQYGFSPSSMNVHPQEYNNLQRAFLQSAMAQNIQIQQQLVAQNNALQKLLEQQQLEAKSGNLPTSRTPTTPTRIPAEGSSKPYIPLPPPLPPDLIEGSRPFVDPYGRAKTVRIGKWRWPPASDSDNFAELKKGTEHKSNDDGHFAFIPPPIQQPQIPQLLKVTRPFGEGVGKLKISSEMRMKLEQVTSVRGQSPTKANTREETIIPKKLSDDRKSLLAEKLGGGLAPPPPPPPPIISPPMFAHQSGRISSPEPPELMEFAPPPRPPMQKLVTPNHAPYFTYNRVQWAFRLRKEVFTPGETSTPLSLNLIFIQVIRDTLSGSIRISTTERTRMRTILDQYDLSLTTLGQAKFNVKKSVVEVAKGWTLYFNKFWRVETTTEAKYIAVNSIGLKLIKKTGQSLQILASYGYDRISSVYAENGRLQISLLNGSRLNFYSRTADDIEHWVGIFLRSAAPPSPEEEMTDAHPHLQIQAGSRHHSPANGSQHSGSSFGNQHVPPPPPPISDGKHSLLQFAMEHFRRDKFRLGAPTSNSWTWSEQVGMVKYSQAPIEQSLLPLDEVNNRLALECYLSIMKYMGDYGGGSGNEVEAVYTLLRNCHGSPPLRDELYCQMMKQTTNNSRTAQRGWRLFTILSAYFTCSEELKPYLFKYLESAAYDKRRAYHGTALVTLQNLRKTFNYGGRRNVPSVEEITAITAGRNAKRQIFRLPGGTQRVLNVKVSTVVKDIIEDMCGLLNITRVEEREEFSIYCIVEGDTFTMPLMKEEYILDVTTELYKNEQVFYLIFCRSVWFFPLKLDSEPYVEVVFNQVAPDYLEGLLLVMPEGNLREDDIRDISRIAALLHRAAELHQSPTLKETKYLLPKPALAAREVKPNQWVNWVGMHWDSVRSISPSQAKAKVLELLQSWELFGSSFFSVRRIVDPAPSEEYIMALNKTGVHFLDPVTHEPLSFSPYNEIISTRKVKNEEGILYLDLKFGNLMQQRISRIQTEHAHEISRLIRMYIYIKKGVVS